MALRKGLPLIGPISGPVRIAFLHIPKCGGTTFYNVLERMLQARIPEIVCVTDINFEKSSADTQRAWFESEKLFIHGHKSFQSIRYAGFDLREFTTIALVREPLDRRISEFYFEQRHGIGLNTFLHASTFNYISTNIDLETRGHPIDFIVPMEQIDLAFFYLAIKMGLPLPLYTPQNSNIAKISGILPLEKKEFHKRNSKDRRLYRKIAKNFDKKITEQGIRFAREWYDFRKILATSRITADGISLIDI